MGIGAQDSRHLIQAYALENFQKLYVISNESMYILITFCLKNFKECFYGFLYTKNNDIVGWASAGGGGRVDRRPPSPCRIIKQFFCYMGGLFTTFSLCGSFILLCFSPYGAFFYGAFPYGGLFATFFSI